MHFSEDDKNMNLTEKVILFCMILLLGACADYKIDTSKTLKEKKFYSSKGFALIYNDTLFEQGGIDKRFSNNEIIDNKLNNEKIIAQHSLLKKNTHIKIYITKKNSYKGAFNLII